MCGNVLCASLLLASAVSMEAARANFFFEGSVQPVLEAIIAEHAFGGCGAGQLRRDARPIHGFSIPLFSHSRVSG